MTKKQYHFTGFSDETGSITNDQPEIFGGSLFVIENSEIDECRAFLKKNYPKGIHCSKIRSKNEIQEIAEKVGDFLKNKICFAVVSIQTNKNLMQECKSIIYETYGRQLNQKELSLIKRWFYYIIIGSPILGFYLLSQDKSIEKITVKLFMEDLSRNKKQDHWDVYKKIISSFVESYKKRTNLTGKLKVTLPESKTKEEEIMFSFSDLFAYAIRRIVTHNEYNLYNSLKPLFSKYGSEGYCSDPNFFKNQKVPPGIFISYISAEGLKQLPTLMKEEWCKKAILSICKSDEKLHSLVKILDPKQTNIVEAEELEPSVLRL